MSDTSRSSVHCFPCPLSEKVSIHESLEYRKVYFEAASLYLVICDMCSLVIENVLGQIQVEHHGEMEVPFLLLLFCIQVCYDPATSARFYQPHKQFIMET